MTTRTEFDAIGTRWALTTPEPISPDTRAEIDAVVEAYDRTWSRFRTDSAVTAMAAGEGPLDLGATAPPLLDLLERLRVLTDGAMSPLVAASLEHLGYGRGGTLTARQGYRPAVDAAVERRGTRVAVRPPALLDVGGAGKGQLADLVSAVLAAAGFQDRLVDASGDVVTAGAPVRVALEHPYDPTAAIGVVELADAAIAGSAVNRRDWTDPSGGRRLHHVLDARTGRPVETIAATWAIAADALHADALATALFLVPPAVLEAELELEWVVMRTDGTVAASRGLPGELFT